LWVWFGQTPAPASKWIGWGRRPASLTPNASHTADRPAHLEIYKGYQNASIDLLESGGCSEEKGLYDGEKEGGKVEEEREEGAPEWLCMHVGNPNPHPQRSPSPSRFITRATMIKNKRRWFREWIQFHLMMGFEHILIYEDESYEILNSYVDQARFSHLYQVATTNESAPACDLPHRSGKISIPMAPRYLGNVLLWYMGNNKQGPCQMAAFMDAIFSTKGGISRWLAF
jgi:hypothetical protein